jgi:type I restriction enzyme S subunit
MTSKNWPVVTIGDIAKVKGGKRLPLGQTVQDAKTAHPYIRVTDFHGGVLDTTNVKYITDETFERVRRYTITSDDVFISIAGTIGLIGIVPVEFSGSNLTENAAKLTDIDKSVDHRFLAYYLQGPPGQAQIQSKTVGTSQPKLALFRIGEIEVALPPLPTQRKIADILSAYDDLIENNTRRIKILEEMAQTIYREWFVHFRFPGHEQVAMVETELGMMPEGWEVTTVGTAFEIVGGGTPSKAVQEYWQNGDITWYTPTDLTKSGTMFIDKSEAKITQDGLRHSSARLFPAFSVMMTSRATIGVLSMNVSPACTNQGFITCIPNDRVTAYYLFFWLAEQKEKILSHASGATFKEISKGVFRTFEFLLPPNDLISSFTRLVDAMLQQALNLQCRNANLRQTRDLLLPKLVSGEVDVGGLEINL